MKEALFGCEIDPLTSEECHGYLAWLRDEPDAPPKGRNGEFDWCLAHCDAGVTWGRYEPAEGRWCLGNQAFPEISPEIESATLHELRVFGAAGEILIWGSKDGPRGRFLFDPAPETSESAEGDDPLAPSHEWRILRGTRVLKERDGFTRVGDPAGAEQVVPQRVTEAELRAGRLGMRLKHYYQRCPEKGSVRVAATRLIGLEIQKG